MYARSLRLLLIVVVAVGFVVATPSGSVLASDPVVPGLAQPAGGTLPHGGWIAYKLAYPGGDANVSVMASYDPADDPNDAGLAGGQVTLAIYGPSSPPPAGTPVAWGEGGRGERHYTLQLAERGDYVLLVSNWDSLGRDIEVGLRARVGSPAGDVGAAARDLALQLVSASAGTRVRGLVAGSLVAGTAAEGLLATQKTAATSPVPAPAAHAGSTVKRVGIQAGHWRSAEMPAELARLRTSTGTAGGGVPEWRLNLDVATRVAAILRERAIVVDLIPSTVPEGYAADAFVALHADGDSTGRFSGYKLAHGRWSGVPERDKALLEAISSEYAAATGLAWDPHVSRNMTGYYAFSNRRFQHAVAAGTPAVILEMGFMTNRADLRLLLGETDIVAQGIANGILRFLGYAG